MMKGWKRLAVIALLLGAAGCGYFKSARITQMVPGMSPAMDKVECWLTIELKKVPGGASPRDLKVRFSSIALAQDVEFDWEYIAGHDVVSKGFAQGFSENPQSRPEGDPPLGVPIMVCYPLPARERITIPQGETIKLQAELLWGGKRVDSDERTIEHVYQRESNR
jgi:hypothetical protein